MLRMILKKKHGDEPQQFIV